MIAYTHTFKDGAVLGLAVHTVIFYTKGERATAAAAERIRQGISAYLAAAVSTDATEYIKGRLWRLDSIQYLPRHGLFDYIGQNCCGTVQYARECKA